MSPLLLAAFTTNRVLFPKLLILSQFFFGFLYWSTNDTSTGQPRSGDVSPDPGQQHCSYLSPCRPSKTTYWIGELDHHVFFVIHIPPKNTRQELLSGWFRGLRSPSLPHSCTGQWRPCQGVRHPPILCSTSNFLSQSHHISCFRDFKVTSLLQFY